MQVKKIILAGKSLALVVEACPAPCPSNSTIHQKLDRIYICRSNILKGTNSQLGHIYPWIALLANKGRLYFISHNTSADSADKQIRAEIWESFVFPSQGQQPEPESDHLERTYPWCQSQQTGTEIQRSIPDRGHSGLMGVPLQMSSLSRIVCAGQVCRCHSESLQGTRLL